MSVIAAVVKNHEIAIAADTQCSFGSLKVNAKYLSNSCKLFEINGSLMGIVGWQAITNVVEHLIECKPELFKFDNRFEIHSSLLKLHTLMKDDYFVETEEGNRQPIESNHLDAIIINRQGLFEIGSYKEVNEFSRFWAIGSGQELAMGAMHALYEQNTSACQIAKAGASAAAEFDSSCNFPIESRVLRLDSGQAESMQAVSLSG